MEGKLELGISEKLDLVYIWWNNLSTSEKIKLQDKYRGKFVFWVVANEVAKIEYMYNLEHGIAITIFSSNIIGSSIRRK